MRPLIIGPDLQAEIDAAILKAKANPTPWEVLSEFALPDHKGPTLKLSDRKQGNKELAHKLIARSAFVRIPFGFLAAISFEHQPAGLCRHLSISVSAAAPGKLPNPAAFEMIAKAFGFQVSTNPLSTNGAHLWIEEFEPGEYAINLVSVEK